MKNPYEVLSVSQDALAAEINHGFNLAQQKNMQTKQYTSAELMAARQQLLSPARRLVADFMHPSRPRAKRPRAFLWPEVTKQIPLDLFSLDAYSSL